MVESTIPTAKCYLPDGVLLSFLQRCVDRHHLFCDTNDVKDGDSVRRIRLLLLLQRCVDRHHLFCDSHDVEDGVQKIRLFFLLQRCVDRHHLFCDSYAIVDGGIHHPNGGILPSQRRAENLPIPSPPKVRRSTSPILQLVRHRGWWNPPSQRRNAAFPTANSVILFHPKAHKSTSPVLQLVRRPRQRSQCRLHSRHLLHRGTVRSNPVPARYQDCG